MKKVEIEKQAIVKALDTAPNITVAAKDLGASRRTLQARMRDYAIPPGQAGRPRQLLPYSTSLPPGTKTALVVIGLLVGAGLGGALVWRRLRASKTTTMVGLDLLGATTTK